MHDLKIEYVKIDDIKPYKNNAKLHPQEQIEQIKNSIQMFGSRGATSSIKNGGIRKGLKNYMKSGIRDELREKAFKIDGKDIISNAYSLFQLNKTGLEYSKNDSLTNSLKGINNMLNEYSKQTKATTDISKYITSKDSYKINEKYSFDTKMIKQAKTVLGKDTKVGIYFKEVGIGSNRHLQPTMIFKNKKGEKEFYYQKGI